MNDFPFVISTFMKCISLFLCCFAFSLRLDVFFDSLNETTPLATFHFPLFVLFFLLSYSRIHNWWTLGQNFSNVLCCTCFIYTLIIRSSFGASSSKLQTAVHVLSNNSLYDFGGGIGSQGSIRSYSANDVASDVYGIGSQWNDRSRIGSGIASGWEGGWTVAVVINILEQSKIIKKIKCSFYHY